MNTNNIANTQKEFLQRHKNLGYVGLIALTLLTASCNDTRTKWEIKADNYAERVEQKNDFTADLQHYENRLEQTKTELSAIQIQIESTKITIQAWNHTTNNAKILKKLSKKEHTLQEDIAEYIITIQQISTELDATKKTVEMLGKTL